MSEYIISNEKAWKGYLMDTVLKGIYESDNPTLSLAASVNKADRLQIIRIDNGTVVLGFAPKPVEEQHYEKEACKIEEVLGTELSRGFSELMNEECRVIVLPVEIRQ